MDAGSYFSNKLAGEKIPHFNDAATIANNEIGVFIEIKSPTNSPGTERVVADALQNILQLEPLVEERSDRGLGLRRWVWVK